MPQGRGHGHGLQRDVAHRLAPSVDKRIVTIYTTLTSSDWAGGDLTTLSPSSSSTLSEAVLSIAQGINHRVGESPQSSSLDLPSAITTAASLTDTNAPLFAQTPDLTPSSTSISSTSATMTPTTTTATATSETAASATSSSSSGGNDVATKAGIALGVLGGIFVILAFVYFIIVRRRKQLEAQRATATDNEKFQGSTDDNSPRPSEAPVRAPRISLRPVTGLFNFNNANQGDRLSAKAAPHPAVRPTTSDSSNASENPFSNHAQVPEEGLAPARLPRGSAFTMGSAYTMDSATLPAPLLTKDLPRSPPRSIAEVSPIESEVDMPVGQAVSTAHVSAATLPAMERQLSERRQSVRKENVPAPLDLTIPPMMPSAVPPSPSGTEFSMAEMDPDQSPYPSAGAASIAADGGPSNTTVHRVQLDFKPTLDDELGLVAGQVVRLLHEYDDGWALCIRLDRSQQGVVPRTCLSSRPVKPRLPHNGGSRGPQLRPQGNQRGPGFNPGARPVGPPTGQRGPGPIMRAMGHGPRPQSPNGSVHRPTQNVTQGPAETQPSPTQYLPGQAY